MLQSRSRPGEKAEGRRRRAKRRVVGKRGKKRERERERERMNTLTVVAFSRSLFAKILAIRGQS